MPAEPHPSPAGRDRVLAALIALVTCLLYAQVRTHEFINFDDDVYVTANPQVQAGLTGAGLAWAFTTTLGGHWHPLTWLSLMAETELHGERAGPFLLTNAALHAVSAALLFLLLLSFTGRRWPSAFVAAAFALHPLRVESVAWVTERKDVQSTLFFLLALVAYVRYVRQPRPSRYAWIVCWFVLGLLTKPMLVTLPAVMLLLDVWPLGRLRFPPARAVVLEKVPLALIALASSATTFLSQRGAGAMVDAAAIPVGARLANATWAYAVYLGQLFWPVQLAVFYPLTRVPPGRAAAAALVLAVITALAWRGRGRHPYVLVGWLWFLGTLLPVIGLVQVGGQARADRFTYVPHVGLLIALAWLAADVARRWPRSRAPLATCAVLALFALADASWRQIGYWRDSETLFRHALDVWPDNFLAHTNLAGALEQRGQMDEAGRHYAEAVRLNPTWPEAQNNMGNVRAREGRFLEAEQHYVAALRLRPGFVEATHNLALARAQRVAAAPPADGAGYTRGNQYARQGRFAEAEAAYREALRSRPDWPEAHHHLGIALAAQGRPADAVRELEEALRLAPGLRGANYNLGVALADLGRTREAAEGFRRELRRDAASSEAALQLAWILATDPDRRLRAGPEAVRWAEKAVARSDPSDPASIDAFAALAAAYAEVGRFPEAAAAARRGAEAARASGDAPRAEEMQAQARELDAGRTGRRATP